MTKLFGVAVLSALALASAASFADQPPPQNVSSEKHERLANAQKSIINSYHELNEAEKVNKSDLGGHITNAKQLLQQADAEIKNAAEYANEMKQEGHH